MSKILLVEDDADILKTNAKLLSYEGYTVVTAETTAKGFEAVISHQPDVIVLDVILPDGDGLALCEKIRSISAAPILFLSCLDKSADKVRGLLSGGDDYMAKPYDMNEFCARIHALLRRTHFNDTGMLNFPPLTISLSAQRVYLNGKDVNLTPREYQILVLLVKNIGKPLSGEYLYEKIWALPAAAGLHTVHVHISSIRRKLELDADGPIAIKHLPRQGYCFSFSPPLA